MAFGKAKENAVSKIEKRNKIMNVQLAIDDRGLHGVVSLAPESDSWSESDKSSKS